MLEFIVHQFLLQMMLKRIDIIVGKRPISTLLYNSFIMSHFFRYGIFVLNKNCSKCSKLLHFCESSLLVSIYHNFLADGQALALPNSADQAMGHRAGCERMRIFKDLPVGEGESPNDFSMSGTS